MASYLERAAALFDDVAARVCGGVDEETWRKVEVRGALFPFGEVLLTDGRTWTDGRRRAFLV